MAANTTILGIITNDLEDNTVQENKLWFKFQHIIGIYTNTIRQTGQTWRWRTVQSRNGTFFRLYCHRCLCAPLCSLLMERPPRGNTGAGLRGLFVVGVEVDKDLQVLGHVVRRLTG